MQIPTTTNAPSAASLDLNQQGFASLTSQDFMRLLLVELQNQDPTEPLGNEQLLSQLSAMRSLQSNVELGDALQQVTSNLQLSTGASFIGKLVTGKTADGTEVSGLVDRAFLTEGQAAVGIGETVIPLKDLTSVNLPPESGV
jgi:flagellar basal-body rod modification protein FlgD